MITSINITQDNIINGSNIIPAHSPAAILCEVEWTGTAPDDLIVELYDSTSALIDTYRAVFIRDVSATVREFAFFPHEPIKAIMQSFDDVYQLSQTLIQITRNVIEVNIKFVDGVLSDDVTLFFAHGAKQVGQNSNMDDVYNNESKSYISAKDKPGYVYFYNSVGTQDVEVYENGVFVNVFGIVNVGLYRYKIECSGYRQIKFIDEALNEYTHTVNCFEICNDAKILKFLDKNGFYRFLPCNEFFETSDTPEVIGNVENLITNLLTAQTNRKNIGYRNKRQLSLVTVDLNAEQLEYTADIFTAPRVYLYNGTNEDTAKDWIEVEIRNADNIVRRRKMNFGVINITVSLPEMYNIRL